MPFRTFEICFILFLFLSVGDFARVSWEILAFCLHLIILGKVQGETRLRETFLR